MAAVRAVIALSVAAGSSVNRSGSIRYVPWPPEKKVIDIGSFYADSTRFRNAVGWEPRVNLRSGFARTLEYYRRHLTEYLDEPAPTPSSVA